MRCLLLVLSLFFSKSLIQAEPENLPEYVSVQLEGQFGNQLFQIATAYAYSLDYDLPFTVPDLKSNPAYNIPYNAKKLFLQRMDSYAPLVRSRLNWREPTFNYHKIPVSRKIKLMGYFQSEKYFKHRRKEILELFKSPSDLEEKILNKYPFLASDDFVVGIQVRDYRHEYPSESSHPTKKRNYYEEAISYFPKDTLFLVSSNNQTLAKECTEGLSTNIIYLKGDDYIEEFYTLSLCKSFIISNSTFGWWAAWLSTAENKMIIAPNKWFAPPYNNEEMQKDIYPERSIILDY